MKEPNQTNPDNNQCDQANGKAEFFKFNDTDLPTLDDYLTLTADDKYIDNSDKEVPAPSVMSAASVPSPTPLSITQTDNGTLNHRVHLSPKKS